MNLKMPVILDWDYLRLKLKLVLVFMQYYLLAFFIVFPFLLNPSLVFSPSGVYNFKTHIMNMIYFSLSSTFCLKMYPSEDVAMELPES